MEASNGSMIPVHLHKLNFFVKSQLGMEIPPLTPGFPIQMLFCQMFLLSNEVLLMMFLLTPRFLHCKTRGSSTREFSRTFVTAPMLLNFGLLLRTEFGRFIRTLELDSMKTSGKILFTPTSSMHDDYRLLSWVGDP